MALKTLSADDIAEELQRRLEEKEREVEELKQKTTELEMRVQLGSKGGLGGAAALDREWNQIANEEKAEGKSKKDKDAPRRPQSTFLYFCAAKRDEVKERYPDLGVAGVAKVLGEMWRQLPDGSEEKKKYHHMAELDHKRYMREMAQYRERKKAKQEEEIAIKLYREQLKQKAAMDFYEKHLAQQAAQQNKKKKDKNAPKRPMSAFFYFCNEKREAMKKKHPKASVTEISKLLGDEWTKQHARKKTAKYERMAEQDRMRYQKEAAEYKARMAENSEQDRKAEEEKAKAELNLAMSLYQEQKEQNAALTMYRQRQQQHREALKQEKAKMRAQKRQKREEKARMPKRPTTAFIYYSKEKNDGLRAEMPGASLAEIATEMGRRWNMLSEAGKRVYREKSEMDRARYRREVMAMERDGFGTL